MIRRDPGWLVTPAAWPCPACGVRVGPGRVRLLWAPGAPLCDGCVAEHGLVDVLAAAEGCHQVAGQLQAGAYRLVDALAIARCQAAADAWTLQRLRAVLRAMP